MILLHHITLSGNKKYIDNQRSRPTLGFWIRQIFCAGGCCPPAQRVPCIACSMTCCKHSIFCRALTTCEGSSYVGTYVQIRAKSWFYKNLHKSIEYFTKLITFKCWSMAVAPTPKSMSTYAIVAITILALSSLQHLAYKLRLRALYHDWYYGYLKHDDPPQCSMSLRGRPKARARAALKLY